MVPSSGLRRWPSQDSTHRLFIGHEICGWEGGLQPVRASGPCVGSVYTPAGAAVLWPVCCVALQSECFDLITVPLRQGTGAGWVTRILLEEVRASQ